MGRQLIFCLSCLLLTGAAYAENRVIPAALWEQPRSGELIVAQPVVRECVETLLAQAAVRLLIHHGRSDESVLQAEELRAWLIALAVDGGRIELKPEGDDLQSLSLELIGITVEEKQTEIKGNP